MYCIDHLCFVCLTNNDVVIISEHEEIYKKFVYTFPEINILGEDFLYVCSSCRLVLTNFYIFKKKCVNNFYRWKSYVKTLIGYHGKEIHNYTDMHISVNKNTNKIVDFMEQFDPHSSNKELEKEQAENEDVSPRIRENMDEYEDIHSPNSEFENTELLFDNADTPETKIESNEFVNEPETYSNENYLCDVTNDSQCMEILQTNDFENKIDNNHFENNIMNNDLENRIDNNVFEIEINNRELAKESEKVTIENNLSLENSENDSVEKIPYNKNVTSKKTRKREAKKQQKKRGPNHKIKPIQELGKDVLCDLCGSYFGSAKKLKSHRYNMHPVPKICCEVCRRTIRSDYMPDHLKSHENKNFECFVCHEKFRLNKDLVAHKKNHGIKEFRCDMCGRDFLTKCTLERHIKCHKGIKDYECKICEKKFVQKNYLNIHLRYHMGIKNSKCDICGASFYTKKYLNIHKESHSNLQLECHICKKRFQSQFYFKIHMNLHNGVKDHECPICYKTYTARNNLRLHLLNHSTRTEYSCQMCEKKFDNTNIFEQHMIKHSEEDKLVCKVCGKHFYRKSNLDQHMKIHNTKENKNMVTI